MGKNTKSKSKIKISKKWVEKLHKLSSQQLTIYISDLDLYSAEFRDLFICQYHSIFYADHIIKRERDFKTQEVKNRSFLKKLDIHFFEKKLTNIEIAEIEDHIRKDKEIRMHVKKAL